MTISFASGMAAEAISCVMWVPIDIIKQRMQLSTDFNTYKYKNCFDAFNQIVAKEGYKGLYRGYTATLLSYGTFLSINLAMYERAKRIMGNRIDIGMYQNFVVALITGIGASLITNPLEVAKVRLQVQRQETILHTDGSMEKGSFAYRNVIDGISKIASKEGYMALWRGCGTRVFYMATQAAINLSLLDKFRWKLLSQSHR